MRRILTLAAALTLGTAAGASAQDSSFVVLDGAFGDWEGVAPVLADPADGRAPYADVLSVQVRADADAAYLSLTLRDSAALQGLPGPLLLLVDTDGPTGGEVHGMRGVDGVIEFSGGPGWGVWLRMIGPDGTPDTLVSANALELMTAPSHAARRFEMRLPRGGPLGIGGMERLRFVALDSAGAVVDATEEFMANVGDVRLRPLPAGWDAPDPLARAAGTEFRVVSWNVGRADIFRQEDAFGALLRPLAPDLLVLDEVAGGRSAGEVEALLDRILPDGGPWRAVYGVSGGSQRGVIATRGTAPRVVPPFDRALPHPDSARALAPPTDPWLRDRLRSHVPVTGAVVQVGGRRLLAVAIDLEAAGEPGGARDRLRRMEALAIRDAVADAVRAGGLDGVLLAGDLNLVASPDPLAILAAGLDVDGSDLHVPLPLGLDGASAMTWENPAEPFTPGRLDFVLVGDAALVVTGGFVFRAADLSPAWRERHGVAAEASGATDHLPIVTDLRWTAPCP
ncbi:MAG TPA: endonuclease/exonuclease/phosphatase family protein [Longimicrobium sp.]